MRSAWWQAFGSTDLNTIVDAALQNNQDIAIAAARISEVMSQADLAQARLSAEAGHHDWACFACHQAAEKAAAHRRDEA